MWGAESPGFVVVNNIVIVVNNIENIWSDLHNEDALAKAHAVL